MHVLLIKKEQHKFYEIYQATGLRVITFRLFMGLESSADKLKAKLDTLYFEVVWKQVAICRRLQGYVGQRESKEFPRF